MVKRGRKAGPSYRTPDGRELTGLVKSADGRFRPLGKSSPAWSGSWQTAWTRFLAWQAGQTTTLEPLGHNPVATMPMGEPSVDHPAFPEWAEWWRTQITLDPSKAAGLMDYPPLAKLADVAALARSTKATSMAAVVDQYVTDKADKITSSEIRAAKTYWQEFATITGATNVADLTHERVRHYRTTIEKQRGKRNPNWVGARFRKVKTIAKYATTEIALTQGDIVALGLTSLLKAPPIAQGKKIEITPAEFKSLLSVADPFQKAMLLVALNCAYGATDMQRLTWDMVDLGKKSLRFDRPKSAKKIGKAAPRIAALWDSTIASLTAIRTTKAPNVFISERGTAPHVHTFEKRFNECREKAGLNATGITLKQLRKAALTAAANSNDVPDRQVYLLAGHAAGIQDHYVVRKNVENACQAIERHYLGTQTRYHVDHAAKAG